MLASARSYFTWAGPGYALFDLGLCLFFASQGAGKILGPVLASTLRLFLVAIGGRWLNSVNAEVWTVFALIGFAMAANGIATALSMYFVSWEKNLSLIIVL